ncbi:MAG: hypothetical protein M1831_006563 [Alyxoria varia]|nr:MAG: hypothetical protein M1831_006563 [Alyxoria varia]
MASPSVVTVRSTFTTSSPTTTVTVSSPAPTGSKWTDPGNGITGGYDGENQIILRALTAFSAIAWYNAIELIVLVLCRFKRKKGLYFWSMLITAISIIVYQTGAWGKMVGIPQYKLLTTTFLNVGWIFMIVGHSIVLYSRLHLITQNRKVLMFVLWMIIINSTLMYIPTTALTYGSNVTTQPALGMYAHGYSIMERIQMTMFTVQELTISGIYLWEVGRFLRVIMELHTRKLLYELLMVNIILIILDVVLLSVEYENLYQIEVTLKGMVYSIKLKMELAVLSKLVKVMTDRKDSFMVTNPDQEVDMKRFASSNTADILTSRNDGEGDTNSEEKCESPASPNSRTNLRHEFFKMASNYRRGRTNSTPSQSQKSPVQSPMSPGAGRPFPSSREKPTSRNGGGGGPQGVQGIDHQYFPENEETEAASPRPRSPPPPNATMTHPSMHAIGTISWAHGGGQEPLGSQPTEGPPCPSLPEMERTSSVASPPRQRQPSVAAAAAPPPSQRSPSQRSPSLFSASGDSTSQRSGSVSNQQVSSSQQQQQQQPQRSASVFSAGGTPSTGVLNGPNERINPGLHLPALPEPTAKRRSSISEMYPGKLGDDLE